MVSASTLPDSRAKSKGINHRNRLMLVSVDFFTRKTGTGSNKPALVGAMVGFLHST